MNIGVFSTNLNFCGTIVEELRAHHKIKVYEHTENNFLDYANLTGLLNWCDVAYFDFIQHPLPWTSHLQWLEKPVVARMDGIDILNHASINWKKVTALIIQPTQKKRLLRLRRIHPNPLPPLPKRIVTCYIGIDLDRFRPDPTRTPEYNITLHSNVIRETKGIYTAIQCFADLLERDPENPWHFTLIAQGEGGWAWPQRMEYVMCVDELLEDLNIIPSKSFKHIDGNLSEGDWRAHLQNQDIYWCLSLRESFGVSMAEACASGAYLLSNHFYGAECLYPKANLCRSPRELVNKTIQWGRLSIDKKRAHSQAMRGHVAMYDQRETAKMIRQLIEEIGTDRGLL